MLLFNKHSRKLNRSGILLKTRWQVSLHCILFQLTPVVVNIDLCFLFCHQNPTLLLMLQIANIVAGNISGLHKLCNLTTDFYKVFHLLPSFSSLLCVSCTLIHIPLFHFSPPTPPSAPPPHYITRTPATATNSLPSFIVVPVTSS